jgi:hypothetical protein
MMVRIVGLNVKLRKLWRMGGVVVFTGTRRAKILSGEAFQGRWNICKRSKHTGTTGKQR